MENLIVNSAKVLKTVQKERAARAKTKAIEK
jgi:hypothetical protein